MNEQLPKSGKHQQKSARPSSLLRQRMVESKLSVNLLPPEILLQRKQSFKLSLANKLSIVLLVTLVFFSSVTLAFRLIQNAQKETAENNLVLAETRMSGLKPREEEAILLKGRLASIEKLLGGDVKRKAIFNLVVYLALPDMQISEAAVDSQGNMSISMVSQTIESFDNFLSNLSSQEKNFGMVQKVHLESLSMGRDAAYRFALKITPK